MPLQDVVTELTKVMSTGITTTLTKSCGKETGTIGSEVTESSLAAGIVTVDGIIPDCPDPTA